MPFARNPRRTIIALFACLATVLAACSSTPKPPKPTVVETAIVAEDNLNPDSSGRPSPLVVRIYELKSLSSFNDADFFSLWDKDQQTLAADLNNREEMVLRPGDKNTVTRITKPDTRFIGVVAAYRDLERAAWRASVALTLNKTQAVNIRLDDRSVTTASAVQK